MRNFIIYSVPNIVRVIKSRNLRWAGHEARMEGGRNSFKILTDIPTGKRAHVLAMFLALCSVYDAFLKNDTSPPLPTPPDSLCMI